MTRLELIRKKYADAEDERFFRLVEQHRKEREEEEYQARFNRDNERSKPSNANNARTTAFELQGLEQLLGIKLPFGFNRVISQLGEIQKLMGLAFSAIAIVAFIDIFLDSK